MCSNGWFSASRDPTVLLITRRDIWKNIKLTSLDRHGVLNHRLVQRTPKKPWKTLCNPSLRWIHTWPAVPPQRASNAEELYMTWSFHEFDGCLNSLITEENVIGIKETSAETSICLLKVISDSNLYDKYHLQKSYHQNHIKIRSPFQNCRCISSWWFIAKIDKTHRIIYSNWKIYKRICSSD